MTTGILSNNGVSSCLGLLLLPADIPLPVLSLSLPHLSEVECRWRIQSSRVWLPTDVAMLSKNVSHLLFAKSLETSRRQTISAGHVRMKWCTWALWNHPADYSCSFLAEVKSKMVKRFRMVNLFLHLLLFPGNFCVLYLNRHKCLKHQHSNVKTQIV